jgi:hypothetical protein
VTYRHVREAVFGELQHHHADARDVPHQALVVEHNDIVLYSIEEESREENELHIM